MRNVKYTDSVTFRCLEHLKETSLDISLIHAGKENCKPSHICTDTRNEFILHFILSGKGFYSLNNGKIYSLSAGQMFLIRPNEPITYGSDNIDPWEYTWIGFNGVRADAILKQCGFSDHKLVLPSPDEPKIVTECIEHMLECRKLTSANDLRREAWMLILFSRLIDYHDKCSQKRTQENSSYSTKAYVELAVEYIKYYYKDGINVSDIAGHLGISRAYLNSAFQKELGISIQKFLIDYRMYKAANLLVSTPDTIKEISGAIGYEDQLNFSKAFKKKFGISPKNYRVQKNATILYGEKQLMDHKEDFAG
ncbi:MAG: AraC family transcriptional regulator [Eubacterium sp.]|nr:AraC family transcriptional regulator [Eubacterium sp.]